MSKTTTTAGETGKACLWGLDIAGLKTRAAQKRWSAAVGQLRASVEDLKRQGVRIPGPDEPCGWAHNYVCPQCKLQLTFDRDSPKEHRCNTCRKSFRSKDMDEAWIYLLNQQQIRAAHSACIVSAIDDDGAGELAKRVLLGYARQYRNYREHGRWAGKGRLTGQSLCEAVWMLTAVEVYRALADAGRLSQAEQDEVRNEMFIPAIELLRRQTSQVHNIHVWHAAAILSMAAVAGRDDDIVFAERIIRRNLHEGVLPDGSWYEGSPNYHFYTLEAFTEYAKAARLAGRPLVLPERLRKMFESPVQMLLPDKSLPLLNDGWNTHPLSMRAGSYEMAHHLFGGFDAVLSFIYRECGTARGSVAFLYGPDEIPPTPLELKRLAVIDGVAVVRRKGMVGLVKSGPAGGSHDHPDKPGLYLFSDSCGLKAADIGNPGYGNSMHRGYYRTTAAHNTIMVDGRDQALAPAGVTLANEAAGLAVVRTAADRAYKDVAIRRCVVFADGWALDWTACTSPQEHDYTWLFHANGPLELADGARLEPAAQPFVHNKYVTRQRRLDGAAGQVRGAWSERDGGTGRLHVQFWSGAGDPRPDAEAGRLVGVADSPDLPGTLKRGLLVGGARGPSAAFVAFFCWGDKAGQPIATARLIRCNGDSLKVQVVVAGGSVPIELEVNAAGSITVR